MSSFDPLTYFFWDRLTPRAQKVVRNKADKILSQLRSHADWAPLNCDLATKAWGKAFHEAGVPVQRMSGNYWRYDDSVEAPLSTDHIWLLVDGFLVDPTAAQFLDMGPIRLENYHPTQAIKF